MPEINSPCVKNCCLDKEDICLGCCRSVDEIIRWGVADDLEKKQMLIAAKHRRANRKKKFDIG